MSLLQEKNQKKTKKHIVQMMRQAGVEVVVVEFEEGGGEGV